VDIDQLKLVLETVAQTKDGAVLVAILYLLSPILEIGAVFLGLYALSGRFQSWMTKELS